VSLLSSFPEKWAPPEELPETSSPLKPKIERAIKLIQLQIKRLDARREELMLRDRALFNTIVKYYSEGDTGHAALYANELAELRRIINASLKAKLALEQVLERLTTIKELGDAIIAVSQASQVIKGVKPSITSLLPEAEEELSKVDELLSGVLTTATQVGVPEATSYMVSESAEQILQEAARVAEKILKEKLPELPRSQPESPSEQ